MIYEATSKKKSSISARKPINDGCLKICILERRDVGERIRNAYNGYVCIDIIGVVPGLIYIQIKGCVLYSNKGLMCHSNGTNRE